MPARSPDALVRPELLTWARQDANLDRATIARKVGTSPEIVERWESGERRPTIKQLRKLAKACHRPLAVFYLPEPPESFQALRDFRRLPEASSMEASFELRLAIRKARYLKDVALELYRRLDQRPEAIDWAASPADDPEEVAGELRKRLGVSAEEQEEWDRPHAALNGWRSGIEALGVMVLQMSGVGTDEARGFSIAAERLPAMVINGRDTPHGRVFTMHHELTHLALRAGGLCDLHDEARPDGSDLEVFCNHVAGAILVPRQSLEQAPEVQEHGSSPRWSWEELGELSRRFSVSREVILRRLLILERTSRTVYKEMRARFQQEYTDYRERLGRSKGGPSWDRRALSAVGRHFARLALESYYRERITASDLSGYFGVKLRHLPGIEEAVFGRRIEFERVD